MSKGNLVGLDVIFCTVSVPTDHPLSKMWELLKKLKLSLDLEGVSIEMLDMLEQLEEMEVQRGREVSKDMKEAYLHVAVELTRDIVRSQYDTINTLEMIGYVWGARMQRLTVDESTFNRRLGSEGLRDWFEKINDVVRSVTNDDADLRVEVESYFEGFDAKKALVSYVYEQVCEIRDEVVYVPATQVHQESVDGSSRGTSSGHKRCRHAIVQPHDFRRSGETSQQNDITPRRGYKWWDSEEVEALKDGVKELGMSNWSTILKIKRNSFKPFRTHKDLRDKWRDMERQKRISPIRLNMNE